MRTRCPAVRDVRPSYSLDGHITEQTKIVIKEKARKPGFFFADRVLCFWFAVPYRTKIIFLVWIIEPAWSRYR
jgi:hypothetical protein